MYMVYRLPWFGQAAKLEDEKKPHTPSNISDISEHYSLIY